MPQLTDRVQQKPPPPPSPTTTLTTPTTNPTIPRQTPPHTTPIPTKCSKRLIKPLRPTRRTQQLHPTSTKQPINLTDHRLKQRLFTGKTAQLRRITLDRPSRTGNNQRPRPINTKRRRQRIRSRTLRITQPARRRVPLHLTSHTNAIFRNTHLQKPTRVRVILHRSQRQRTEHPANNTPQFPIVRKRPLAQPPIHHAHRHAALPARLQKIRPQLQFTQHHNIRPNRIQKPPNRPRKIQRIPPNLRNTRKHLTRTRIPSVRRRRHNNLNLARKQTNKRTHSVHLTNTHSMHDNSRSAPRHRLDLPEPLTPTPPSLARPQRITQSTRDRIPNIKHIHRGRKTSPHPPSPPSHQTAINIKQANKPMGGRGLEPRTPRV